MKNQNTIRYYMNEKQVDKSLEFTSCHILGLPADDRIHQDIQNFDVSYYLKNQYGDKQSLSDEMIDDILASKSYLVERWKYIGFLS